MTGSEIDPTSFGAAAADYAQHRAGFPAELFDRLATHDIGLASQRIVDLGTGTGTVARELSGRGCNVIGIDPDTRLTDEARRLGDLEGVEVEYVPTTAEATGLEEGSADVVMAGQCWHWFDQPAAVAECRRILAPGRGRLAIVYLDWIPLPGNPVQATEQLIETHNPAWHMGGRHGMWPEWVPGVQAGGFTGIETFSFDLVIPYTPEGWRGRVRASAGITSLEEQQRLVFDAELADLLEVRFPGETIAFDHRVWAMVATNGA